MAWKLCEHGTRGRCKPCGRGYCKHSKVKQMCRECDGRDFCEHDKRQSSCKECKGKSICKHDKRIQNCIKCCPDSFCVHKRLKNNCKICGGNNRCIHNIMKSVCVECGGGSLCVHGKKKQTCKECYPKKYKKWREYRNKRRVENPSLRLKENMRSRVWDALKNNAKSANTETLVGCTIAELWNHLESQFDSEMTRDNYGEWHVDHIIPCDAFDLSRPEEQRRCFNYRNLQPMWGSENSSKGNEYKFNIILEIELFKY